jgi:hypothetical protein
MMKQVKKARFEACLGTAIIVDEQVAHHRGMLLQRETA